ncbi:MAG: glycosyltransferase family 39 protein [Acidobacteria bacterium]|nr:glycosyltransferase family 39 protein [Acidobacteriota bacterium]
MSASAETITTARLTPELFFERGVRSTSRTLTIVALALIVLVGFAFRVAQLGAEGLSEDELNKLHAVEDYRAHGLTAANGEHPMLMKALLTGSIVAAEGWNQTSLAGAHPSLQVSTETALRLPGALFGALTSLLIFLVVSELFGTEIGLIAAVLWAIDPTGISFNRIAKEDTFLLFFFLLANVFWVRGQRVAESGEGKPEPYYWATAAAFGAMMASKYLPHFLAISVSYYYIFQGIPATRWRMGKRKWLIFFGIMGAAFLLCNPTILLPGTWHEMRVFAGEKRIGHDSYEFMGTLYRNQMTLWLKGSPWYFYYVFMGVKLALPVVLAFIIGLPLLFRKKLGDGRFLLLFWLFYWFVPFTVLGGKFTRYFTMALPVVLITAAIGLHFVAQAVSRFIAQKFEQPSVANFARACVILLALTFPVVAAASVMPHYRLYTNVLGGGWEKAGSYFPHDEFYDASARQAASEIATRARLGARVASETPGLIDYYARLAGRSDLVSLSLTDHEAMRQFTAGDFVIIARGRRYFSNEELTASLQGKSEPAINLTLGRVPSVAIYRLDETSARSFVEAAAR